MKTIKTFDDTWSELLKPHIHITTTIIKLSPLCLFPRQLQETTQIQTMALGRVAVVAAVVVLLAACVQAAPKRVSECQNKLGTH